MAYCPIIIVKVILLKITTNRSGTEIDLLSRILIVKAHSVHLDVKDSRYFAECFNTSLDKVDLT